MLRLMTVLDLAPATRPSLDTLRADLRRRHRLEETEAIKEIMPDARLTDAERRQAEVQARSWIEAIRKQHATVGGVKDFLQEFNLSTQEGVALMCVAEALLRIPDAPTADDLIRDKLGSIDWESHEKRTGTLFANASVWGLMLTGSLLREKENKGLLGAVKSLASRAGQPVIRSAIVRAMGLLGDQFVLGRTIGEALDRGADVGRKGYRVSYDMLGEGARTSADAERYFEAYRTAIAAIGKNQETGGTIWQAPSISVKLSALHPRFTESQRETCFPALVEKLTVLAEAAAGAGISLTVDAEESERLELWFDIVATVLQSPVTLHWPGLGIAAQAYQKRTPQLIGMMGELCHDRNREMMIRLVKGAYWDSEIKRSQMSGQPDYPVYTRKVATDVSYLACARRLLSLNDRIFAAFGSHNAFTLASILSIAKPNQRFEFQRLQGMGSELHDQLVAMGHASRIYAPVGSHQDLLAYLVRRILENGANSSFVHKLRDEDVPVAALVHDPEVELAALTHKRNPSLPLPVDLFARENRKNSMGVDLDAPAIAAPFMAGVEAAAARANWSAAPLIGGSRQLGDAHDVFDPADQRRCIGSVIEATLPQVEQALSLAAAAQPAWAKTKVEERAHILEKAGDLLEQNRTELVAMIVREAGRTVKNAIAEVREAVDLCRYYAVCARYDLAPHQLPGYTGETNELRHVARGIVAAISPWNFPLAIFVGQIAAALVAGNAVMAKPAEQTPLIALRAVQILHHAGVPPEVLALLPGRGETVGAKLVNDPRVAAVVFTGSTEVGRAINQALANRAGAIVPLIAETGGLNALIVDSTALPEQVTDDVLQSAFDSAGQRCSSLRILFVQEDVADKMVTMITEAIRELHLGDPLKLSTDIGPLIDGAAKEGLLAHIRRMEQEGRLLYAGAEPVEAEHGAYLAPHVFEIPRLDLLKREAFGPVLHIIRWQRDKLDDVVKAISATGYGLTGGIHSRRESFVRDLAARLPVGNLYVNRNVIGAIPGVQPFGGEGLSGTGPKAGGPHYVRRFTVERVVTTDTTAAGGNASLLMLEP